MWIFRIPRIIHPRQFDASFIEKGSVDIVFGRRPGDVFGPARLPYKINQAFRLAFNESIVLAACYFGRYAENLQYREQELVVDLAKFRLFLAFAVQPLEEIGIALETGGIPVVLDQRVPMGCCPF